LRLSIAVICPVATLLALLPGLARAGATRDVLFVGNSGDGTVDLFDASTFARPGSLNAIPDGNTPRDAVQALAYPTLVSKKGVNYVQDVALSPGGLVLYVSRDYLGDVAAFPAHARVAVAGADPEPAGRPCRAVPRRDARRRPARDARLQRERPAFRGWRGFD
jgi:hypothetical protein